MRYGWGIVALQYCVSFAVHQSESAIYIYPTLSFSSQWFFYDHLPFLFHSSYSSENSWKLQWIPQVDFVLLFNHLFRPVSVLNNQSERNSISEIWLLLSTQFTVNRFFAYCKSFLTRSTPDEEKGCSRDSGKWHVFPQKSDNYLEIMRHLNQISFPNDLDITAKWRIFL